VAGTVERTHAAVGLGPDAEIEQLQADVTGAGKQFAHVPPVHAGVDERPVVAAGPQMSEHFLQEVRELGLGHLAGGHREFTVGDPSLAGCVAVDFHVVRRIGEHRRRLLVGKDRVSGQVQGASAIQSMRVQMPEIARLCHDGSGSDFEIIGFILRRRIQGLNA
jgi:hypothetical protein